MLLPIVANAAPLPYVSQYVQQEYETAIEVSKKFQKGFLSKEEATDVLIATFSDYSHPDGKVATMNQFITKALGIENPRLNSVSEQRGWSGSEIHWIQDEKTKEAQYFLKIFPYDSKHYLPEIFGLSFMSEVKGVGAPTMCAFGQCFINATRCFLVLETPVKGISIQQYFRHVGQHPIDSEKRTQALAELCEAVRACGVGLARFHAHLSHKTQSFPQGIEEEMREDLDGAIEELAYQPKEGIEIEKLQGYTDSVLNKMKAYDHLTGLTYDDVKTIHTFYDEENKQFSLVNPDRLYLSINPEGESQGLLIRDVCKYLVSLTLNRFEYSLDENQHVTRKELLSEEEVNMVKTLFESGYSQGGGTLPDAIEKEYAILQHDLFFIKNTRRALPEPELTRVRDLINISLENIKSRLKEVS